MADIRNNIPEAGLFAERLDQVCSEIARRRGSSDAVNVVAVTKGFDASAIGLAKSHGLAVGENYAQELIDKVRTLDGHLDRPVGGSVGGFVSRLGGLSVHFIGQLQSNKVRVLADVVDIWESADRRSLIAEIAKRKPGAAVFVQVNVSDDPGRGGCAWSEAEELVEFASINALQIRGLMTVGIQGDVDATRVAFKRLAKTAAGLGLKELSMGMSDDWQIAVDEGATSIRLGRALFGARNKGPQ